MSGKTRYDRDRSPNRLSFMMSIPMDPRIMERLDDMAHRAHISRAEFVRALIVAAVEKTVPVEAPESTEQATI